MNGARIMVSTFGTDKHYISHLPRSDLPPPAMVFMPGLMRQLYSSRVDVPPGMFHFVDCADPAPAPAATPEAPTP